MKRHAWWKLLSTHTYNIAILLVYDAHVFTKPFGRTHAPQYNQRFQIDLRPRFIGGPTIVDPKSNHLMDGQNRTKNMEEGTSIVNIRDKTHFFRLFFIHNQRIYIP